MSGIGLHQEISDEVKQTVFQKLNIMNDCREVLEA